MTGLPRRAACALAFTLLTPVPALACACGCGIFDVGNPSLMTPNMSPAGLSIWFRYAFMDQNQNWQGASRAPAADNNDRKLITSFYTVGGEYTLNQSWAVEAELPLYARHLTTTDDGTVNGPAGSLYTAKLTDLGDAVVSATYTGFSPDMSTGLIFGAKLPTGNDTGPNGAFGGREIDRDSRPGTGSTDIVLGGYHLGMLNRRGNWQYFSQVRAQIAVLSHDGYRPGDELDGAVGASYAFGPTGPFTGVTPLLQLLGSVRQHDTGANADPPNSGYRRLFVSPGVQFQVNHVRVYTDLEIPVAQSFNTASEGNSGQLAAPVLVKMQVSYDF